MKKLVLLSVLSLAACGETSGWNPNYTMNATKYGDYQRAREVALTDARVVPSQTVPVTLPVKAPTAEEIAGPRRVVAKTAVVATPVAVAAVQPQQATLVNYANANRHNPGTRVWQRGPTVVVGNPCASFANPPAAQLAFLQRGGPAQDPMGIDPDGDGFVCGWNPAPYRVQR
ncbi:MAG: hypothetical protein DI498_02085 [Paracoccus denitrificans]|nr:MAG: hypothetical protein DI498_02085 [Paracoccus denitrificans]PZO85944.1 MAG: hypothetical protein DI633_02085 [Paracoccus denitrificans]